MSSFGEGYEDIDDSGAAGLLDYLDDVAALPAVAAAKEAATDLLELAPGERVLEVGAGSGADLAALSERVRPGGSVTGIDPSAQAVARAGARLAGDAQVTVTVAGVEALPFGDGEFDAARADRTLQHVEDLEAALAEIRRVLRPGGRLAVLEVGAGVTGLDAEAQAEARRLFAPGRNETAVLMLPLLLGRAGFGSVRTDTREVVSTRATDAEVVLRLASRRPALEAAEASGELRLRLLFTMFAAVAR